MTKYVFMPEHVSDCEALTIKLVIRPDRATLNIDGQDLIGLCFTEQEGIKVYNCGSIDALAIFKKSLTSNEWKVVE